MTFSHSIRSVLIDNYAQYTGTASRSEYWWFVLFASLVITLGSFIISFIGAMMGSLLGIYIAIALMMLGFISPMLSVWVRRCHDVGRSTIEALLVFVLTQTTALTTPLGGNLIELSGVTQTLAWAVFGITALYTLYLSTKSGTTT